jgi:DNA-binding HxlR family transcriptional regulator
MISGKYKLRIVWDLKDGPRRYGEIRSGLLRGTAGSAEITPRVLSRELKALTASGLIDRKDFGEVPPKVEYRLTRKGKSFVPVVAAIRDWGDRNLSEPAALANAAEYSMIRKSVKRFSLATNAERVCAEIMLKQKTLTSRR